MTDGPNDPPLVLSGWDGHRRRIPRMMADDVPDGAWLLVELLDGSYRRRDDGRRYPPGTRLLLPPGAAAGWERSPDPREVAVLFRFADPAIRTPEQAWRCPLPEVLPDAVGKLVADGLRPISGLWWWDRRSRQRADGLLGLLLVGLITVLDDADDDKPYRVDSRRVRGRDATDPGVAARLQRVERLCEMRLNTWRTEDMAHAAGMGRTAFSRWYRRHRGEPPGAFLDRMRRRFAERFLARPEEPDLAWIAASIGFADASSMARWFRRQNRQSPLRWRARSLGGEDRGRSRTTVGPRPAPGTFDAGGHSPLIFY